MGEFKDGGFNGKGMYRISDQVSFKGNWVNDMIDGPVILEIKNNFKVKGYFGTHSDQFNSSRISIGKTKGLLNEDLLF